MGKGEVHARTGHVVGLRDVNFNVKRGEIFVIMGLSGSGKSTAIRTVNKLLDTTNGQVMVDGVDVQTLDGTDLQEFRREMTGMVFQHFALFPHRTIIDNVGYGLKIQGVEKSRRDEAHSRRSRSSASRRTPATRRASSRAACSSVSASPGLLPPIRPSCSWTRPSRHSTH